MKNKLQQAKLKKQMQDSQDQLEGEMNFEIKHILIRGYSVQYYSNLSLFLIYNEINYHCWNLLDNSFQQNLGMNKFLNDDLTNMGIEGPCDSTYLFKSDNHRLKIYDLINLKKLDTIIPAKFSNFYQTPQKQLIIRTYNNQIYYCKLKSKYEKKIMINTNNYFDRYLSDKYFAEAYINNKFYQLRHKSLKIIRNRVFQCKFQPPSQYCYQYLIVQQSQNKKHLAVIYDKDSMKIKFQTKIQKDVEDYINIKEKQILIILITKNILILNQINFGLIHKIQTYHHPRKLINFMSFDRNTLILFYKAPIDSKIETIQYL